MPGYDYNGKRTKEEPTIVPYRKIDGKAPAPCGTDSGYYRHIGNNEWADEACKLAHNKKTAQRKGSRPTRRTGRAPCGTPQGFYAHRYRQETPCLPCLDAFNRHIQKKRANKKLKEERNAIRTQRRRESRQAQREARA